MVEIYKACHVHIRSLQSKGHGDTMLFTRTHSNVEIVQFSKNSVQWTRREMCDINIYIVEILGITMRARVCGVISST